MKLGFMGLGRMGKGLVLNMHDHDIDVVATNRRKQPLEEIAKSGVQIVDTPEELLKKLDRQKILWLMLTAGSPTDEVLFESGLFEKFNAGDIIIDGGNSNFNESRRRYEMCKKRGVHFLDVGVSGGPDGARNGAAVMVGGDKAAYEICEPIFKAISVPDGYGYMGESGSGHFVKMVHNAIEYGILQAMGEGFELLKKGPYSDLDLEKISEVWRHGTVIRGFLMDLLNRALKKDTNLQSIKGFIEDNGEGKWAIQTAMDHNIPFNVNTYALMFRYITRQDDSFAAKVVAALRHEFGGHEVKKG